MGDEAARAAVATLHGAVDALLAVQLTAPASAELPALLAALEVERRRLDAVDHNLVAEIDRRGLAGDYGNTSTADLLVALLHVAPAEAKARVRLAGELAERRAVVGEPLAPLFPAVAAAQTAGLLSSAHAKVIARCLDTIPAHVAPEATPQAEAFLVAQAQRFEPGQLTKIAHRLIAHLDPDGIEPREREIDRKRSFTIFRHGDGSFEIKGRVTAAFGAVWNPILDTLAAPRPAEDGIPDDRTPGQRRHDAMLEAGQRLLRSGTLPDCGGTPVTMLVRIDEQQLRARTGLAETAHGDVLSIDEVLRMASEAEIVPVVLNDTSGVMAYGRCRRLASAAQRHALSARDGGCCFPGCRRPASWTEVHHILAWVDGGLTNIDQMCLLCGYHHRTFEQRGWSVHMCDGRPEWIPPAFFDPLQRPIRNTAHHLPEFDFAQAG